MWPTPTADDAMDLQRSSEALARAKEKGGCANLREHVLTSSPEDSPASLSAPPESNGEPTTTATSGLNLLGLWSPSGRVGACLKMLAVSSTWRTVSPRYTLTWKRKATKWGACLFQLRLSERRTAGSGSGSSPIWPTPDAQSGWHNPHNWPNQVARNHQVHLAHSVGMWPTPTQQDGANTAGPSQFRRNSLTLNAAAMFQTPMPSDVDGGRTTKGRLRQGETGIRKEAAQPGMKLSAAWVSRLMGYPDGWMQDLPPDPLTPSDPTGKRASRA